MTTFLNHFMIAACSITDAERAIAFDTNMTMQAHMNVDDSELEKESFTHQVEGWITQAMNSQKSVIANNLITDPAEAPKTNVHLKDLRMVVAIPLEGNGAIYLDQPIRKGVFERDTVDKLTELADQLIKDDNTDINDAEIVALYNDM